MAVINMNVALFSIAGDTLGISKAVKFAMNHRISAVNASMVASEIALWGRPFRLSDFLLPPSLLSCISLY